MAFASALAGRLPGLRHLSTSTSSRCRRGVVRSLLDTPPAFLGVATARGSRHFSVSGEELQQGLVPGRKTQVGLWGKFVQWSYRLLGNSLFPTKADFCNCGADLGVRIPRPELLEREGIKHGSLERKMQLYGAAMYWHMATMASDNCKQANPDLMRGKDVLEVACMRGGGARYLAEVAGPRRYVAIDNVQAHIDRCRKDHGEWPGLEYEVLDAIELADSFPAESFDFVLCIQAANSFEDMGAFVRGASKVLRPGGLLLLCDAFSRTQNTRLMDALQDHGFDVEATIDMSRAVHAVGLCEVPKGLSYVHVVARKD
ncbi:unnamed protein product [Polarella glacialis]|uniref:Methyltransferase type 11 domain-containing protein n=1 Tax=Polarella glacialis TaxID=89957 RepID=A0A813I7T3_POLGL|nr:unnamed protein product [Polarella glacialis]